MLKRRAERSVALRLAGGLLAGGVLACGGGGSPSEAERGGSASTGEDATGAATPGSTGVNDGSGSGSATASAMVWTHDEPVVSLPLSAAVAADDGVVIVDAPGDDRLLIVELDGSGARSIEWLETTGPTYVAIGPA